MHTSDSNSNEIVDLQTRLQEAEELINAIRDGSVDAFVISGSQGERVYTLQGTEYTYRLMVETMEQGAAALSVDGSILYCNRRLADMVQCSIEAMVNRPTADLIAAGDRERFAELFGRTSAGKTTQAEMRLDIGIPVLISMGELILDKVRTFCMLVTDLSEQKRTEKALATQNAELKKRADQLSRLSCELTMTEQRERRRLAELLHDHLQQLLAGARLNLDYVSQENAPAQHRAFKEAHDLVIKSLETARTLSTELSPPVLYMHGLSKAFKWLARWMETTHDLQVDLQADPQADPVQEEVKMLLFQSVRELLFNAVKHSGTNAARLEMKRQDDRTIIKVSDQGTGFDIQAMYLFNIRERLLLLGGAFEIASDPSTGTTVTLIAPIQTSTFSMPEPKTDEHKRKTDRPAKSRHDGKIRVMLVDDHAVMRKGLSLMLSRHKDIEIAGEAANGQQAVELAAKIKPDVILMDISMPVMDGVAATRIISEQNSKIRIIGLSMHAAEDQAAAIKNAGAAAYLCKSGSPDAIISAIRGNGVAANPENLFLQL